jgi:hypothetical protein
MTDLVTITDSPTFRLFSTPNFWKGVARIIDLFGTLDTYNVSATPEEADKQAFLADWECLSSDAQAAYGELLKRFGAETDSLK